MSTAEVTTDPTPIVWTDAEFDRMVALGILPANHSRQAVRFTRDQYRAMAEHGFFDGRRVCLLHGVVIDMAAMKEPHVSGVSAVSHALRGAFGAGFNVRTQAPLDVDAMNDPEPDVAVVPGDFRTYRNSPTPPHASVALVVVEVADSTLTQDTSTKPELYATAGVLDYWVVDVVNNVLLVFRDPYLLPGGTKTFRSYATLTATDTVTLLAVPNTPIPVADLLP
jgi:Uma2 family endonuclease